MHCDHGAKIKIENSYIAEGVLLEAKREGELIIKNTYVGPGSVIVATQLVRIDDDCMVAEMVVIRDQNHTIAAKKKIVDSPLEAAPIHIHKNVWLGAKSTVLKGVVIGENSIVGAHSLVNKSLPEKSIAVGTPAKIIKSLSIEH